MGSRKVGAVWLVGLLLAAAIYATGPDQFMDWAWASVLNAELALRHFRLSLSTTMFNLMRAAAIGLFVVFLGLGIMAARRGLRARVALVFVSLLFLLLVGNAGMSEARWVAALILVAIAASVMSGRLR